MVRFRVDTSGYSSRELVVYKDGNFCKTVTFEDALTKAGFSWDYEASEPMFTSDSKQVVKERINKEMSKYADDYKITNYCIEYPWETVTFELKCECGSEKVNSNRHSGWCPKYKPF